jgi:hypothetical protein
VRREDLRIVTRRAPGADEFEAKLFGWRIVKHVKSNAIVYAGPQRTLGIGAGQMSRVDSSRIAVWKAGEAGLSLKGSVVCSDAFFPFADGLIAASEAGATAAIQPGGSVRDPEVIAAADGVHRRAPLPALTVTEARARSGREPANQRDLRGAEQRERGPGGELAPAQAALPGRAEPELEFHGAGLKEVPVAQRRRLDGLTVERGEGVGMEPHHEPVGFVQVHLEMPVPDTLFRKAQVGGRRAPNLPREPRRGRFVTGLAAGEDAKPDHHQNRRGTMT